MAIEPRNMGVGSEAAAPARRLLRIREVARDLAVSPRSVWRLIAIGGLPAVRLGRATRVPADAVDALIQRGGAR